MSKRIVILGCVDGKLFMDTFENVFSKVVFFVGCFQIFKGADGRDSTELWSKEMQT